MSIWLTGMVEICAGMVEICAVTGKDRYIPCDGHRVVNHTGRLAPHFYGQKELLLEEKVEFKDETHVNMKKCQWEC